MNQSFLKAQILVDALPYIQQYRDEIIVIKYGGNAMINTALKEAVMSDIVLLSLVGIKVVLVHGGGPEISGMLDKIGKETHFIDGLRYTDQETMDIVQMILCGKINKNLVKNISAKGAHAMGLCGLDDQMITAKKLIHPDKDWGYVGEIVAIHNKPIIDCLNNHCIPVIATVASDRLGNSYNINADTAAAKIAASLHAKKLILLTDIQGLMYDVTDENSLISSLNVSDVPKLVKDQVINGGMIPKIESCVESIRRGVEKAHIIDGRIPHSILIELLSHEGIGTMIE